MAAKFYIFFYLHQDLTKIYYAMYMKPYRIMLGFFLEARDAAQNHSFWKTLISHSATYSWWCLLALD